MKDEKLAEEVANLLKSMSGKTVAIVTHVGGDADAVGAAYVLKRVLEENLGCTTAHVHIPDEMSAQVRAMVNYLKLDVKSGAIGDVDAVILVDIGSLEQVAEHLEDVMKMQGKVYIIDHHAPPHGGYPQGFFVFFSESYRALCELVMDVVKLMGIKLDTLEAEALFLGIYYDTARLSLADSETMANICELVKLGINPSKGIQSVEVPIDISERIARLKGAMRMNLYRAGEWLIATSQVSSFQTSVARAILSLGCHVSIVAGEYKNGVAVSMRSQQDFFAKTNINLGKDVAQTVGARLGGYGGGHATAARAYCNSTPDEVIKLCLNLLEGLLGERLNRV
ncbi:MAG: DHH family phosphoesterase [Thaumarchaeota archaeon]|jgi:nanoRNase/pAp phosphatase (c-di-AMP/oligoRNAs hydrolase)|nr:DHH family phosphoesterase [Candidatus Terraquivivens yellowstonensis]